MWLLCILPLLVDPPESTDVLEVQHFYDDEAKLVFDQLICWEWLGDGYRVKDWRLIKHPSQIPTKERGLWVSRWYEQDYGVREVWAPSRRERWLQYDAELEDRLVWPKELRTHLRKPR